jgi:hypothetical protein
MNHSSNHRQSPSAPFPGQPRPRQYVCRLKPRTIGVALSHDADPGGFYTGQSGQELTESNRTRQS